MVNVLALKVKMLEKGVNQSDMADKLGICNKTMGFRMKNGIFNTREIDIIQDLLGLSQSDVIKIFFEKKIS